MFEEILYYKVQRLRQANGIMKLGGNRGNAGEETFFNRH